MSEQTTPKYKVGDKTKMYWGGSALEVEEIVDWKDGIIRYKLRGYGGLVQENEC